jgi:molybdopterin-guanine dinucleotide biosynthesis protein B
MKIVTVVGAANAGKTTVIERLTAELTRRGFRVGVIKHAGEDFEIDRDGSDSRRFKAAGAGVSCVSAKGKWAAVSDAGVSDADPEHLAVLLLRDCSFIIAEGYKNLPLPKIEVYRREAAESPVAAGKDELAAIVTDDAVEADVPIFRLSQTNELADFVEKRFKNEPADAELFINGREIPMNRFVREFMAGAVMGMTGALRGVKASGPAEVMLRIRGSFNKTESSESGGPNGSAGKCGWKE